MPPWIEKIGPKWAMVLGSIPYILMVGATLAPSYYLSVPMNVAVGLGAPLLWTGSSVYIGRCAVKQAKLNARADLDGTSKSFEKIVNDLTAKLNSVFFTMFQGNGTIGLCLSSIVLHLAGDNGVRYLFILLVAICACGVFILSTLPKIPPVNDNKDEISASSWTDTIRVAFTEAKVTLLIPLFFYNGLSLGFLFGDFTNDVIHKAVGLDNTGFVMAVFFFVNAVVSYVVCVCVYVCPYSLFPTLSSHIHTLSTVTPQEANRLVYRDVVEHHIYTCLLQFTLLTLCGYFYGSLLITTSSNVALRNVQCLIWEVVI